MLNRDRLTFIRGKNGMAKCNVYVWVGILILAGIILFSPKREDMCCASDKSADKYEYKVIRITSVGIPESSLNTYGDEGWELVWIHEERRFKYLIFKRKVVEEEEEGTAPSQSQKK